MGRMIDADALLKRVEQEEIQALIHGREFLTCFMSPGGTPSTEWWFVEDLIENAPTIEERKKGNWIGIDDEPCETFECDRCGFVLEDWIQGAFYNYCPNCGAKMEGK